MEGKSKTVEAVLDEMVSHLFRANVRERAISQAVTYTAIALCGLDASDVIKAVLGGGYQPRERFRRESIYAARPIKPKRRPAPPAAQPTPEPDRAAEE